MSSEEGVTLSREEAVLTARLLRNAQIFPMITVSGFGVSRDDDWMAEQAELVRKWRALADRLEGA